MHLKCHALSLLSTLVNQACWTNRAHVNTQIKYHHSGIPIFLWYLTRVLNLMDSLTCLSITQNKKKKNFIPAVALLFARLRFQERNFHHCWNIRPGNRVSEFHTYFFVFTYFSLSYTRATKRRVFGRHH